MFSFSQVIFVMLCLAQEVPREITKPFQKSPWQKFKDGVGSIGSSIKHFFIDIGDGIGNFFKKGWRKLTG